MRWHLVLLLVAAGGVARAAPTVDIKAKARLALEKVKLRGDGDIEVTGQLVDKLTSEGISAGVVTVRLGGKTLTTVPGADGHFRAVFSGLVPGPQPVELRFAGSYRVDRADPVVEVVDPSRAQVTLSVRAEPTPAGVDLYVTAMVEDLPSDLPVLVAIGDAAAAQLASLPPARTGAPIAIARAAAGGPGSKRVRVTFRGDATRQQASAETTFDLTAATVTEMTVGSAKLAYEDDLVITGHVRDEDGHPVARAQVALVSGDRRLAQAATADDGAYRFEVEAEIVAQGHQLPKDFGIQIHSEPVSPYLKPSSSKPGLISVAAPQPVPVSYTVAAFLATVLAAGGFFTARAKPWRRLRKAAAPAEAPSPDHVEVVEGGLVANRPGLVSTLRRPHDDGFSGVVRDTVRGRPIADAVIRLVLGDHAFEHRTAADGTFAAERLAPGEWRAEVRADGHVTERFAVAIPHRGELRGVRIDLVPVRERVFQLYRRAAEPALPEARLWGIWSPRQIIEHVRARRPSPALAELTDFVEEVYFSPRVTPEAVLPRTSEQVDRAIRERAAV